MIIDPNLQRRKLLQGIASAGVCVAAGVAVREVRAAGKGRLLIWFTASGTKALRRVGDWFTAETGIPVTVDVAEAAPTRFRQAAAVGKGPDLCIWAHDQLGEFISSGLIMPVLPSRKLLADLEPQAVQAFTASGRLWAYPFMMETISLIYNKALVNKPPETFEDVMALDAQLAKSGRKAILWEYTNTYFSWPLMAANGGYAYKQRADGSYDARDVGVNNEGALKGMELMARLVREGYMPQGAGYPEMEAAMAKGQVAMMINGPWSWDNLRKAKIDFGIAKIPRVAGKPAVPFIGVRGVMMNKSTPNRELAVEFIENYMLSHRGLGILNDNEPIVAPASKAYFASRPSDANSNAVMDCARDGVPMPNIPEMASFWPAVQSAIGNVTEGRQSPTEALAAAQRRMKGAGEQ